MDPTTIPPEIAHTMGAAAAIAGIIRGLVALLRTPLLKSVWDRMPWYAKPATLLGATVLLGTLDAMGFGQVWYLAVGSAITGLGGAVVSYEWQDLFKEAAAAKKAQEAAEKLAVASTPPSGVLKPPA
jgi:hypothetical protein